MIEIMRKGNKKTWVILLMAVFIVISISILAALYLHNDTKSIKNIKEFSNYVTDYKKEFEEYILDKNENKTMTIYNHLTSNISKDFMESKMKQREFRRELSLWIEDESKEEEIFNLWKNTRGC